MRLHTILHQQSNKMKKKIYHTVGKVKKSNRKSEKPIKTIDTAKTHT